MDRSVTLGLLVTLEAQPGKEAGVEEFLNAGRGAGVPEISFVGF